MRITAWFSGRPDRKVCAVLAAALTLALLIARTRFGPRALWFLCSSGWTVLGLLVIALIARVAALPTGAIDYRRWALRGMKWTTSAVMLLFFLKLADVGASLILTGRLVVIGDFDLEPPARQFSLYPYTGFHTPADRRYHGPMPYETVPGTAGRDYTVDSGDHGFWVDFDLDSPPAKGPDEFRILLIGGSAAQGWGGTTNERMLYRLLEKTLQARCAGRGIKVRVVNLAMGGSITYQNFVALNLWGHQLEPDLILSFSGRNEMVVGSTNESDAFHTFFHARAAVEAADLYNSPSWLKTFYRFFPSLVRVDREGTVSERTPIGITLRGRLLNDYEGQTRQRYLASSSIAGVDGPARAEMFYVHALRSIRRDFPAVPLLLAFQPIDEFTRESYERFISGVKARLAKDPDPGLVVYDVHQVFAEQKLFERHRREWGGVHLTDELHPVVAELLAEQVAPVISLTSGRRSDHQHR